MCLSGRARAMRAPVRVQRAALLPGMPLLPFLFGVIAVVVFVVLLLRFSFMSAVAFFTLCFSFYC
jgi:hypothetical protein